MRKLQWEGEKDDGSSLTCLPFCGRWQGRRESIDTKEFLPSTRPFLEMLHPTFLFLLLLLFLRGEEISSDRSNSRRETALFINVRFLYYAPSFLPLVDVFLPNKLDFFSSEN